MRVIVVTESQKKGYLLEFDVDRWNEIELSLTKKLTA